MPSKNEHLSPRSLTDGPVCTEAGQSSAAKWQKLALLALGAGLGVTEAGEAEAQDAGTANDAASVSLPAVKVHGQTDTAPLSLPIRTTRHWILGVCLIPCGKRPRLSVSFPRP